MMDVRQMLQALQAEVEQISPGQIRLFFITRIPRSDIPRSAKALEKFEYQALSADVAEDLQSFLQTVVREQLEKVLSDEHIEILPYQVVGDDQVKVYRYALTNKGMPFAKLIYEQLSQGVDLPPVTDLVQLTKNLWAYVIAIKRGDGSMIYSFRRTPKSRVAVDERQGFIKRFTAVFDTKDKRLDVLQGESINLDGTIDCLYIADQMLVFAKRNFENLVGLEDEFHENAGKILNELEVQGVVKGIEVLKQQSDVSRAFLHRMANLARKGIELKLTPERIKKMRLIARQHGLKINFKKGQFVVESKEDADEFFKLLDDYFLESRQTGTKYGTHVKTVLQTPSAKTKRR